MRELPAVSVLRRRNGVMTISPCMAVRSRMSLWFSSTTLQTPSLTGLVNSTPAPSISACRSPLLGQSDHKTADELRAVGGFSLSPMKIGDFFAIAIQLSSINPYARSEQPRHRKTKVTGSNPAQCTANCRQSTRLKLPTLYIHFVI